MKVQSKAEIVAERDALKAEVARLKSLLSLCGGRKIDGFVAVPINPAQWWAVNDVLSDHVTDGDYEVDGEDRKYEVVHTSCLPEFSQMLSVVCTDNEGNQVSKVDYFGLVPAR